MTMTILIKPAYANRHGYSDVSPCEIIREVSAQTLEIRDMEYSENLVKLTFHAGGFVAHCSDQHAQEYEITSNPTYRTIRIRLNKRGEWQDKHGQRYVLSDSPKRFYDYNF